MQVELQSAWIQVLGTGVFTIVGIFLGIYFGRQFEKRDRSNRKLIETIVTSTALVNPSKIGPLTVSVDKEYLTSNLADKGVIVPVKSAYNFIIEVSNTGIDDIEKPEIDINFGDTTSILQTMVKSDSLSPDKMEVTRSNSRGNFVRITPQYINRQKTITISILTVDNEDSECNVVVGGFGIDHKRRQTILQPTTVSSRMPSEIVVAVIGALAVIIASILSFIPALLTGS